MLIQKIEDLFNPPHTLLPIAVQSEKSVLGIRGQSWGRGAIHNGNQYPAQLIHSTPRLGY